MQSKAYHIRCVSKHSPSDLHRHYVLHPHPHLSIHTHPAYVLRTRNTPVTSALNSTLILSHLITSYLSDPRPLSAHLISSHLVSLLSSPTLSILLPRFSNQLSHHSSTPTLTIEGEERKKERKKVDGSYWVFVSCSMYSCIRVYGRSMYIYSNVL